jgi:ferrous iron transport protein B
MTRASRLIGLAGNPNSGKTTLFNALTGLKQHTGNWPGVTVEKKSGLWETPEFIAEVVDLPGIYGLTAHSLDERVTRDFILDEHPDLLIVVADAVVLDRGLYLLSQMREAGVPCILALNRMDAAEEKGLDLDTAVLERILQIPLVPMVATKGRGLAELQRAVVEGTARPSEPLKIPFGEDLEPLLRQLEGSLDPADWPGLPHRWVALKILEEDPRVLKRFEGREEGRRDRAMLAERAMKLCALLGYRDLTEILAERRYGWVNGVMAEGVRDYPVQSRIDWTNRLDAWLTHRWLGLPLFLLTVYLAFQLVFTLGNPFTLLLRRGFDAMGVWVHELALAWSLPHWCASLAADGIIGGVGSVLSFLPNIALLFFFIALLEDSGYMARAAFLVDRVMHGMGLHGKSFLPMVLGFGCNVPAILGTRILDSQKDRRLTILVIPFMSCSARLPVYTLFAGVFFRRHQGLVVFSLYLVGVALAFLSARLLRRVVLQGPPSPLIMELPPYHRPSLRGAAFHMWARGRMFVRKAGTVIVSGVVLVWALGNLPPGVGYGAPDSYIGRIGAALSPLLAPAGCGFPQAAVALLSGIFAKEIVVGTLGALTAPMPLEEALRGMFTPLSAYAFMLMALLYIPCLSTVAVIRREAGWRWALLVSGYTLVLGWLAGTVFYQGARFIQQYWG